MPPQTNVHAAAPQTKSSKGLLGLFRRQAEPGHGWSARSTVRALGHTWSSNTQHSARRPVWE